MNITRHTTPRYVIARSFRAAGVPKKINKIYRFIGLFLDCRGRAKALPRNDAIIRRLPKGKVRLSIARVIFIISIFTLSFQSLVEAQGRQVRWDNIVGKSSFWLSKNKKVANNGDEVTLKLDSYSHLRIHCKDCDIIPEMFEVKVSNGSGAYTLAPLKRTNFSSDLILSIEEGNSVVKIKLLNSLPKNSKLDFFKSRYEKPIKCAHFREKMYPFNDQSKRILEFNHYLPKKISLEKFTTLNPGHALNYDIIGPTRLEINSRIIYDDNLTSFHFPYKINIKLDEKSIASPILLASPNYYDLHSGSKLLSKPAKYTVSIPEGAHKLTLQSENLMLIKLYSYTGPSLQGAALSEHGNPYSTSKAVDCRVGSKAEPPRNDDFDFSFTTDIKENRCLGLDIYNSAKKLADLNKNNFAAKEFANAANNTFTFYRNILPSNVFYKELSVDYAENYILPSSLDPKLNYKIHGNRINPLLNTLISGYFIKFPPNRPLIYILPKLLADSKLRVLIQTECIKKPINLYIACDDNKPKIIKIIPGEKFDKLKSSGLIALDILEKNVPAREKLGTFSAAFAQYRIPSDLKSTAILKIPLPAQTKKISIAHDNPENSIYLAAQYKDSKNSDNMFGQFADNFEDVDPSFVKPSGKNLKVSQEDKNSALNVVDTARLNIAILKYGKIINTGSLEDWRNAHINRAQALKSTGESFLAEQSLKALILKASDEETKILAAEKLISFYKERGYDYGIKLVYNALMDENVRHASLTSERLMNVTAHSSCSEERYARRDELEINNYGDSISQDSLVKASKLCNEHRGKYYADLMCKKLESLSRFKPITTLDRDTTFIIKENNKNWDPQNLNLNIRKSLISDNENYYALSGNSILAIDLTNKNRHQFKLKAAMLKLITKNKSSAIVGFQIDDKEIQSFEVSNTGKFAQQEFSVDSGKHSLRIFLIDPYISTFVKLLLYEKSPKGEWEEVNIVKKNKYIVIEKDNPSSLTVRGPAFIRVHKYLNLNDEAPEIYDYFFTDNKTHKIDLRSNPQVRAFYKIYAKIPANIKTSRKFILNPLNAASVEDCKNTTGFKNADYVNLKDDLMLYGQDIGTFSLVGGYKRKLNSASLNAKTVNYFQEILSYRYFSEINRTYFYNDVILKELPKGRPSLGLNFRLDYIPASMPFDVFGKVALYTQCFAGKQNFSVHKILGIKSRIFSSRVLAHNFTLGLFDRNLSTARNVNKINVLAVDPDVYSNYANNHKRHINFYYKTSYRPYLDSILWGEIAWESRKKFTKSNFIQGSVGFDKFLDPLVIGFHYANKYYLKSLNHRSGFNRNKIGARLSQDMWLNKANHRLEIRGELYKIFDSNVSKLFYHKRHRKLNSYTLAASITLHLGNGRNYRDFRDEEIKFKDLKVRKVPISNEIWE